LGRSATEKENVQVKQKHSDGGMQLAGTLSRCNSKVVLSYLHKQMEVGLENRCYIPYIQYRIKWNSRPTYGFVAF
jgi:hypothetical protein